jgi:dephospho-CoA kinase
VFSNRTEEHVGHWKDKYVIGLTGNIAMGKSLVRRMLEHLGAYTLDADGLAHQIMAPNAPAYQPIVEMFGKFIVQHDGQIDRTRLGAIAFAHADALRELEKITHPIIRTEIDAQISRAQHAVVVVEAIKLIEGDLYNMVDAVWVVDATPENQQRRLMEKRKLSQVEAQRRIRIQNPQGDKLAKADVVIQNNGSPDDAWAQVQSAWGRIPKPSGVTAAPPAAPAPAPTPAPTPAPAAPTAAPTPAPAAPTAALTLTVRRPMPPDFEKVAQFINEVTGSQLTRTDVMATFGEKTYIIAENQGQPVGLIAFVVENLVTRVTEFMVGAQVPIEMAGKVLIEAMEKASSDLQSEVAFVFIPQGKANHKMVFKASGYEDIISGEVRYPAWREAVNEYKTPTTEVIYRRLRESLVLKPI